VDAFLSHIFISYSKRDKDYARKLVNKLRDEGFDVWIDDRRLRSSEDWWSSIVLAIWNCDAFIALLSPASDSSRWVQREVTLADGRGKPIFPLLLEGDINTPNWALFVRTQYVDVRDGKLPPQEFFQDLENHAPRKQGGRGVNVTATAELQAVTVPDAEFHQAIANAPALGPEPDDDEKPSARRRLPLIAAALIVLIALVGATAFIMSQVTPTPSQTLTPGITQLATESALSTEPASTPDAQPVSVESLNTWRTANGYSMLTTNPTLDAIANVHMSYLSSLPISDLPVMNLYLDANGEDADAMAAEAGYVGDVQMFVEVRDESLSLDDLLTKFQMEGSTDMQSQMREIGFAQDDSSDTGKHYFVLVLGTGS
jgi:hypothetical protein